MKSSLLLLVLLFCSAVLGQSKNVLIDRAYWKNHPTLAQVQADVNAGNDPAAFNDHKFDAVTWAILEDASSETIWFLLNQKGNDVNKRAHDGRTPIFWAAYRNNIPLMKALIEKDAQLDILDSNGASVANFAASTGQCNTELYELLIAQGVNLKKERNSDGATPLLLIIPHVESTDMITYFTSKGLKLEDVDNEGNNAFVYAAKAGNEAIMNHLLNVGISARANNDAAVLAASKGMRGKKNTIQTFEYLKSKGLSMTTTDSEGRNAMHFLAARSQDHDLFEYFFEAGLSLNTLDANGQTPYLNAFEHNTAETVSFLLSKEDLKETTLNAEGENVIHIAAKRGDLDILKLALQAEKNINVLSDVGLTPLHVAAMKSKGFTMIEALLTAGADKTIQTPFEETAFDLAKENSWLTDKQHIQELLNP